MNKSLNKSLAAALSLILTSFAAGAADNSVGHTPTAEDQIPATNTEINKRDRNHQTLTPMDQSGSKADREITQGVRKSIMRQELSMNAKNIKVITRNGEVTLRGPVNSTSEVEQIVQMAKAVPGVKTLKNELEVK